MSKRTVWNEVVGEKDIDTIVVLEGRKVFIDVLNRKYRFKILLVFTGCFVLLACGVWYLLRHTGLESSQDVVKSSHVEKSSMDAIESLGYVTWAPIEEKGSRKKGVTKYIPTQAYKGVNLYFSESLSGGFLLDMYGKIKHTFLDKREDKGTWKLIEPYQNNDFLVMAEPFDGSIFLIDWDSNIKWVQKMPFTHDIAVADNGDIYSIIHKKVEYPNYCLTQPIVDNSLLILTKDGNVKKEISFAKMISHDKVLFDAARNQKEKRYDWGKDAWEIFHTNSLQIIDRDIFYGNKKLFKKGYVLFCIRYIDTIGMIDVEKEEIVWSWGLGVLDYPHHPSLLENGNILIFDNGYHRKYSRVIELNPATGEIEWDYRATPAQSFKSGSRGSAQRLPNGNTLIAESDRGRVFEVTRDGKIVWEFYSMEVDSKTNKRATIYRMMRIADPQKYPRLNRRE